MCCMNQAIASRFGLVWGLLALTALLIAFVSGSWVYTKEPLILPNSQISSSVAFKIGLWKVCSTVKRINSSVHTPSTNCVMVKYTNWEDLSDIGWEHLDMTPAFISRIRSCTILCTTAVVLLLMAILCALIGHCNSDNKTVIGCGLFILGGLSLGSCLVIFVSSLSETLLEIAQYNRNLPYEPSYDYTYGWCFFAAGVAFLMTNMAAAFSIHGYLHKFPNVDDMVRQMVPGAERKFQEQQYLSKQYEIYQKATNFIQYHHLSDKQSEYDAESGPLLNKTPPDVCTTNKCADYAAHGTEQSFVPNVVESDYNSSKTLAGQTVPIIIKKHTSTAPLSFSNLSVKFGTIQSHSRSRQAFHPGFFGVSDLESSSSMGSSGYCDKSKTLQYPKNRIKCDPMLENPENYPDYGKRPNNDFTFSGSAV